MEMYSLVCYNASQSTTSPRPIHSLLQIFFLVVSTIKRQLGCREADIARQDGLSFGWHVNLENELDCEE